MGEFNSDDHYIYYYGQESLRRNKVAIIVNKGVWNVVLGCNLKNERMALEWAVAAWCWSKHQQVAVRKILKKMGIPDHLTSLLKNLYADQKATVRTGHRTTDWFQIGKEVRQGCILSPCLFNLYAEYIMRNAGLEEAQAGIRFILIYGKTNTVL